MDREKTIVGKRIVVAMLWACWPAFLCYLLILQFGYVSRSRVGLAILLVPLFGYAIYKNYCRIMCLSPKDWLYIGVASTIVALLGKEVLLFYPQKTYLFDAKHILEIKMVSFSDGQRFALDGFQTSLGDVSFDSFQESSDWLRIGNELIPNSIHPNPLTWSGWVGNDTRLYLQGSPGVIVQVEWDGRPQTIEFNRADQATVPIETTFIMPEWGRFLLFLVLWIAIVFLVTVVLTTIQKNEGFFQRYQPFRWMIFLFLPLALIFAIVSILKIFLPLNPNALFPGRDSGVFLYIARHFLEGQVPYRDVWDHKGPMIYFIDALGLMVGKGTEWGVWCLEIVWILASILSLYFLLTKVTGHLPAFIGCIIFLGGFEQALSGGNFTEEYGLLYQVLIIILFLYYLQGRQGATLILAGVFISFLFMLRPNQIAVGIGLGLYQLTSAIRSRFSWPTVRPLIFLGIGFLAPVLFMMMYFMLNRALGDLMSAVFTFNRIYVGSINIDLINGFYQGLYGFPSMGLWIVLGSASLSILLLAGGRDSISFRFWSFTGLSFLIEIFLSNLSQAGFRHYYLTWLPYIALFAALAIHLIIQGLSVLFHRWGETIHTAFYGIAILVSFVSIIHLSGNLRSVYYPLTWISAGPTWDTPKHPVNELKAYLGKDSSLLIWGAETSINYMTGVDAPTRFVYQYPLMSADYATPEIVNEFTSDISASLPVIVDASAGDIGIIPLEKQQREQILMTSEGTSQYDHLLPFFNYFDSHYRLAGQLSYRGWLVYLPIH